MRTLPKILLCGLVLLLGGALPMMQASAQNGPRTVSGTVLDASGEPLPGAGVMIKGTMDGTTTDLDGNFKIDVRSDAAVLEVSFIGFTTQDIAVGDKDNLRIALQPETNLMEETIVVGYMPMRKSDFTGSVSNVSAKELPLTTPTVSQALVGKVAGVEVRQTSGAPGDGAKIRVRGVNSLSASSDPLYVIDGYPASEDVYINPSDIETIDVLKDAASAAIYGSRGASGVILITTKRGKTGESAKISYDFSYGWQQVERKVDLLDANQVRDLVIDARNNAYRLLATAKGVAWSPYDDNETRVAKGFRLAYVGIHPMFYDFTTLTPVEQKYNTDWQDELFGTAGMHRHNVSVTGGTKKVKYMASVGYMDQDGIISPSNHNRINARLNLDAQVTKRLSVQASYSMSDAKNRTVPAAGRMINDGIIQSALMYLPNLPVYTEDGSDFDRSAMINLRNEDWGINMPENPLVIANDIDVTETQMRHNLNANITYEFIEGLKLSARLGSQWYTGKYNYYRPMSIGRNNMPAYSPELAGDNISRAVTNITVDRLGEFILSYNKTWEKHHFDALLGYTLQRKTSDKVGVEAKGFADDRIHEVTAHGSDPSDIILYDTGRSAWSMMSYLARANYAYDGRYTLTASFRADGSSRFGINNRWGYFPSVSAGWAFTNEPFLKDALENIMEARIRASWGQSGNNNIGNYNSIAAISTGSYAFGNTANTTAYEASFRDAALGWETTTQTNIGLDLSFLNDRISLIGNFYNSVSSDILYKAPLSSISGSTTTTTNMDGAKIRNRGFDVQIDARILQGAVTWSVSGNISVNRNKVLSLGGLDDILSQAESSVGGTYGHITKEGYPIGSYYGYKVAGIMSETDYANALLDRNVYLENGSSFPEGYKLKGPAVNNYSLDNLSYGNIIWQNTNGDNTIDEKDKTILGDAYPDFTGGFSTSLQWAGLDFSANFTFSYGAEVINYQNYYLFNMEGSANQFADVAYRYRSDAEPGKNNIPLASRNALTNTSTRLASYFVEDASYLRCANVTLGYTLPSKWMKKIHVSKCRLYVSGDNLFTLTKYRGFNPEVSSKSSSLTPGFDWGCYPLSRIFSVGLNLTF